MPKIFSALQRLESGKTLSADELRLLTPYVNELVKAVGVADPAEMLKKIDDMEK